MAIPVLLVTPGEGFGELIRQTLEDGGDYRVVLVDNGADALARVQQQPFVLAILDGDVKDIPLVALGRKLLSWYPDISLIVVPPKNNLHHKSVVELAPQAMLTKPFYLPNLLRIVESVLRGNSRDSAPVIPPVPTISQPAEEKNQPTVPPKAPPWLQDVNLAAQHLARLSLSTSAQAALITRADTLWAYAGSFPQGTAQELTETIAHYWSRYGGRDLARFIQLSATGDEYMLYATSLGEAFVLALIFNENTPFGKIRAQAAALARALAASPRENGRLLEENSEQSAPAAEVAVDSPAVEETPAGISLTPTDHGEWLPAFDAKEAEDAHPPSETEVVPLPADWQPHTPPSESQQSFLKSLISDPIPLAPLPYQQTGGDPEPAAPAHTTPDEPETLDAPASPEDEAHPEVDPSHFAETRPSKRAGTPDEAPAIEDAQAEPAPSPYFRLKEAKDTHTAETKPSVIDPLTLPAEPASPTRYSLTYASVLIPRFPHHHLVGNIATLLGNWVPQICVAFGWRVERLSIRPEYAQWITNVPPATSPDYLIRIVRKITSQRIFAAFPEFAEENPSGDFWAPGYFIISSPKVPHPATVKDFIAQTRKRQGFSSK